MKTRIIDIDASSAFNTVVLGAGDAPTDAASIEHLSDGRWRAVYNVDGMAVWQANRDADIFDAIRAAAQKGR